MKIVIDKKAFELRFGFKCFMNLGKELGLKTFNEVAEKFTQFEHIKGDISFEQIELIEKLVIAAAEAHPNYYSLKHSILEVAIVDELFAQENLISDVMTAFAESVSTSLGKQKASKPTRSKRK